MRQRRYICYASYIVITALFMVKPLSAGTKSYDLEQLLFNPHPFGKTLNRDTSKVVGQIRQGQRVTKLKSLVNEKPIGRALNPANKMQSAQTGPSYLPNNNPGYLSLGLGYFDINDNKSTIELRLEKRLERSFLVFQPFVGLMSTGDKAFYGYGGISLDWVYGDFIITPSFAAGLYADGDGKDLGHAVEFRSALELSYEFKNHHRLGLMFYHLSNASLSNNNPGTEVLSLGYSIPFSY